MPKAKTKKQKQKQKPQVDLSVQSFENLGSDSEDSSDEEESKHWLLPKGKHRTLICGPSNSGKTCLLFNYILKWLTYDKIYLYSKHLEQRKYRKLIRYFRNIEDEIQQKTDDSEPVEILVTGSDIEDVSSVDAYDSSLRNLVIFDDFITVKDPENKIVDTFVRGRHMGCSVIYLSQMYFKVPRSIRLNCSHVCIFNVSNQREINMLNQELAFNLKKEEFKRVYLEATSEKYSFLYIDRESKFKPLQYRKRLDCLFTDI